MKALKLRTNFEFELIVMSRDFHYQEVFDLGIRVHYVIRKKKKDPSVFRKFYRLCKSYKPDIVHCWDSMTAFYMVPATRLLRIKLVNGMVVDTPVRQNIFNKHWLRAKLTFLFSSIVIGNSRAGLKAYQVSRNKGICIYNGFNFERVGKLEDREHVRSKFGIRSKYVVLMVGAFQKRKDYDSYIDAAKILLRSGTDVEFLAVGEGEDLARISEKAGGENGIRFLGKQSDVESIINISDLCVLTTNSSYHGEGISNSILEYMALGKPVIATTGGGTNEIVEEMKTGFLIGPSDPVKLAEKIRLLLNDESLRHRMGMAGKERIHDHFSIDQMVDKYISIYENCVSFSKNAKSAIHPVNGMVNE